MELDIIKLQTTWNDAAGSINSNYAKIADAIAQLKANGGGGGISELTSKMVVDALGYTPYNATNPANYITSDALSPYAKTADVSTTYATIASIQGFENRIGGLEGAVPQLNARVETVESKVATLNEYVVTGDNNLLNRVNVIEEEYATKTYVDNAIDGIDLSLYLLKADLTKSRIQSTLGISDWALASVKPTYTASEVGALSLDGTSKMQQSKNIEWSNTEGYEDIDVFSNGLRLLGYNASKGNYGGGIHIGTRYGWQLMTKWGENPLYYRSYDMNSQIWRDWERLAFASDIPTNLSQLTDDVVAGKYLPLSGGDIWGSINLGQNDLNVSDDTSTYQAMRLYPNYGFYIGNGTSGNYDTLLWGKNIHFLSKGLTRMYVQSDGKVGIGNISPTERLDVSGNIKASGNINATSITINGVTITASNGSITVNGNVIATGSITAKKSV